MVICAVQVVLVGTALGVLRVIAVIVLCGVVGVESGVAGRASSRRTLHPMRRSPARRATAAMAVSVGLNRERIGLLRGREDVVHHASPRPRKRNCARHINHRQINASYAAGPATCLETAHATVS